MIIEAICVVAGVVSSAAWAAMERGRMQFWRREAKEALDMASKAVAQRDEAEKAADNLLSDLEAIRGSFSFARARSAAIQAENADLRAKLEALQPKPKTPPKRGKNGRFVAREVGA